MTSSRQHPAHTPKPKAYNQRNKAGARFEAISYWREHTGLSSIPSGQTIVSLCGDQTVVGSQLNQLVSVGFCTEEQYVGIDRDPKVICANRLAYPKATFLVGEWTEVIALLDLDHVSFVDLDTTSLAGGSEAARLLGRTLHLVPPTAFVAFNVMMNNPRSSVTYSLEIIRDRLSKISSHVLRFWDAQPKNFGYMMTDFTLMRTFCFTGCHETSTCSLT